MKELNARLVGRTFTDCYGQTATVIEGIAGLAPGYVCVRGEDGRTSVETLHYVLSSLPDKEPDLVLASSLLAQAATLQERAVTLAAAVASEQLDNRTIRAVHAYHSSVASIIGSVPSVKVSRRSSKEDVEENEAEQAAQAANVSGMRI